MGRKKGRLREVCRNLVAGQAVPGHRRTNFFFLCGIMVLVSVPFACRHISVCLVTTTCVEIEEQTTGTDKRLDNAKTLPGAPNLSNLAGACHSACCQIGPRHLRQLRAS
jgi:hypothetical protein